MTLSAIQIANSGLRTTQAAIDVLAGNVANAGTAGYVKRRANPIETTAAGQSSSVRAGDVQRTLSTVAQRQLRLETAGAAYTSLAASATAQLDALFGKPGGAGSLDGTVNAFASALETLASDPSSTASRSGVVGAARTLADRLASLSVGVQGLRSDAEARIGADVVTANGLLAQIGDLNTRAVAAGGSDPSLLDRRDAAVDRLAALLDVRTTAQPDGSVTVTTGSGMTLVDHATTVKLAFDGRGALSSGALWSADADQRGTGTITATVPGGGTIDLIASGAIRSGSIAAGIELRDTTLVKAQRGLDELAAGLSRALSDRAAPVTAASSGSQQGFDIALAGLQPGNAVTLDLTTSTGAARRVILVPTNGATPATVDAAKTADPTATVVTFDASGGASTYAAKIGAALAGLGVAVSAPSGAAAGTVRILNDGTASGATPRALAAGITVTTTASGEAALPLFVDTGYGGTPFTGSFQGGSHLDGLSGRLAVNPAVLANSATLVAYASSTLPGDATRPAFLAAALNGTSRTFAAASGINGTSVPYTGTVQDFALRLVETQGANAASAADLDEGQQVALANAQGRFAQDAGVSIDEEMSQLVQLQTAYSANARVLAAARDMMDALLRI